MGTTKKPEFTIAGTLFSSVGLIVIGVAIGVVAIVLWRGVFLLGESTQQYQVSAVRSRGVALPVILAAGVTLVSLVLLGAGVFAFFFGFKERNAEQKRAKESDDTWRNMPFPKS